MSKIERFGNLISWQKARELTKEIYKITRLWECSKDFGLSGQMQRASVSIMSNIAKGFERGCGENFINFYPLQKLPALRFDLSYILLLNWLSDKFEIQHNNGKSPGSWKNYRWS